MKISEIRFPSRRSPDIFATFVVQFLFLSTPSVYSVVPFFRF